MILRVLKKFKDKNNSKKHYVAGDKIEVKEISRINNLVKRGLCELLDEEGENKVTYGEKTIDSKVAIEALKKIGVKVVANTGVEKLNEKIAALTEEQEKAFDAEIDK